MTAPSSALTLAFDTSGAWCAAALMRDTAIIDTRVEEMSRGQGERLMLLLQELLQDNACDWPSLTTIGVGTGPGNFTGIRIAVSAARGLAMGLNIPAIGVDGFQARAACHPAGSLVAIPAPRDRLYIADPQPRLMAAAECPDAILHTDTAPMVQAIARIAATTPDAASRPAPAPLYVRPADAAPPRDAPPVLLD